jgi:hypothetical protein
MRRKEFSVDSTWKLDKWVSCCWKSLVGRGLFLPPRNLFDSIIASLLLFSHQMCILLFMGLMCGPNCCFKWTLSPMDWIDHDGGAFTLDVKSVLNENLGGILHGTQF